MIVYCSGCKASFSLRIDTSLKVQKITAICPRCGSKATFRFQPEHEDHSIGGTEHKNDS